MRITKSVFVALSCALFLNSLCINTMAISISIPNSQNTSTVAPFSLYATNSFSFDLLAHKAIKADTPFSMEAGDIITINASYAPFSSSVDFGLFDESGFFHHVSASGGEVNASIHIPTTGRYTLGFRNNSDVTVKIVGTVRY